MRAYVCMVLCANLLGCMVLCANFLGTIDILSLRGRLKTPLADISARGNGTVGGPLVTLPEKKGCFVVLVQVGNEGHILQEWLEHHLAEGASHFYIANRNPLGSMEYYTFLEQIAPYVSMGVVTWWTMPQLPPTSLRKTVRHFESVWSDVVLPRARTDAYGEWLLVIDMDEFFYAAHNATVSDVLCRDLPRDITQVCAPWVFFQNSGNVRQPSCVVPSFTTR